MNLRTKQTMKQTMKKPIFGAIFLTAMTIGTNAMASTEEDVLAKHLMASRLEIVEAHSLSDLSLARYSEEGPTVAVIVATSKLETLYYAEINDVGAILVSINHLTNKVTTVQQAHTITCEDIRQSFLAGEPVVSICDHQL
jgi:hypothetical protein